MEIDPPAEENEKKIDFAFSGESEFMNEVYEAIGEMQNTNTNVFSLFLTKLASYYAYSL